MNSQPGEAELNTDRNGNPIVGHILDIIDEKRSRYAVAVALAEWHTAKTEEAVRQGAQAEHDKIYALYNEMFEPNGEFRSFVSLTPEDVMAFFERLKELEDALNPREEQQ